ncbi:MAG: ABC transporter ATP-binding protein [Actinomycetota bacterium]|nr:ABC transporter ATP-binding protein [Actinomycetota bacterium]
MADPRSGPTVTVRDAATELEATRPPQATRPRPEPNQRHDVIRTIGLSKTYPGGRTAVDGLDLSVRKGEIFALLGPNGAGKTTTVGMLTTRVVPSGGTALVNGVDVVADPGRAKATVGVVSQANTLDRSLTVWENLYFHGRYFGLRDGQAKAEADGLLERFRLTGRAKAAIATLSGGMAKRLMLARAFLPRPAVIFLDEPTAGLDPQSRLALWDILGALHAEGETILITTHYMEEAERLAQRVAIMDRGRLLALGTPERLRRAVESGTVLVVDAVGDLNRLAAVLRLYDGVIEATPVHGKLRIRLAEGQGSIAHVAVVAYREGLSIRSISVEETSLETVFISLTGKDLRE